MQLGKSSLQKTSKNAIFLILFFVFFHFQLKFTDYQKIS